ncbi:MAG: DUF748 domain-containing protein, partial [Casimicrobiaceae bacterium]
MTTNAAVPASAARKPRHWRGVRNTCIVIAGLAVLVAALGFFVVPRVAKSRIEALARADLGREATLGKVEFNPFTLHVRLTAFKLADRDPSRTLLAFDALDIHASIESLWKLAPVIDALKLSAPKLILVRDQGGHVNVEDLVARALSGPQGPTPRFSIDNIEIENGAVTFDDELRQRTTKVAQLGIGIPFLSSFPHDATIRVLPKLVGTIDGSKFAMSGTATSPFADTEQATLHVNLDAVGLAEYASYLTVPEGLKLADGALTTRLTLAFVTGPSGPRAVTLAGTATLDGLLIRRGDDSTLVAAKSIATDIAKIDVLAHTVDLARVDVESPIANLRRRTDGSLELASLAADNAATARVT